MKRDELLDNLTQDILTYVMHGTFPERYIASEIKPEGLDERFNDYERLIRLHFILRPDVVEFVELLPKHLRSVKTQTESYSNVTRGKITGRINWTSTFRERNSSNPRDPTVFVCEDRSENYDIDENLVLKKLISIIYRTLEDCEEYLRRDYDWVSERWRSNVDLIDSMKELVERNVHVKRIRDPDVYEPTERMVRRAEGSRSEIYRLAAGHIRTYERTIEGDETAIRELLEKTAITPDDDETLFELFVLFKFISTIERMKDDEFTLQTIESDSQEVAKISNDNEEIVLYHNNSARDRGLSFIPESVEKGREDLSRTEVIPREARETVKTYFRTGGIQQTTGRPDVIILEITSGADRKYLITEVKHSSRRETVYQGIKETLEYLAFLRQDDELVFDSETGYFGTGWNGLLVIQDIPEVETAALDEQRSIRILQAGEVEERLEEVLETVIGT